MSPEYGFRGYISSRPVRGTSFPPRIQNAVVRSYAARRALPFKLSLIEYAMPGCFMMLESLLEELPKLDGIIVFSMFMLPPERIKRLRMYDRILAHETVLHAALEETCIGEAADIRLFEDTIDVACALRRAPFAGRFEKDGARPLAGDPFVASLMRALAPS